MNALEIFISCSLCAPGATGSAFDGGGIYFDASAGLQAVLPGRHDLFTGRHAIIDDGNPLANLAYFERPGFDSTVGLDDVGVIAVLPALQRTRRHGHYIGRSAREKSDVQIFARPERAILIWEGAFRDASCRWSDRSGCRGLRACPRRAADRYRGPSRRSGQDRTSMPI